MECKNLALKSKTISVPFVQQNYQTKKRKEDYATETEP